MNSNKLGKQVRFVHTSGKRVIIKASTEKAALLRLPKKHRADLSPERHPTTRVV